jgi:7-cyano-7-deazaguanine synthase
MKKAVVLVSGGMDSLVTACIAKEENEQVFFLHVNYGQRTIKKELESFERICEYLKPTEKMIIELDFFKNFKGNSLTDNSVEVRKHDDNKELPNSYVPYRNGIFLSIAVGFAEVMNASRVYIGAVEVDGSEYPDCTNSFFQAMETAISKGTARDFYIKVCTPLISLKKSQIITLGTKYNAPFDLTWSCYKNEDKPCGECDSCYYRAKAFADAGIKDPIQNS